MKLCKLFLVLLLALTISGCGYSNPYNSEMPGLGDEGSREAVPVFVTMWNNRTSELGFQSIIYRELIKWLKKSKMITLVSNRREAEYILEGEISSIRFEGLSYDENDNAIEIRAVTELSYALRDREKNEIVWQRENLIRRENFRVAGNSVLTSGNRRKALGDISRDIAQVIYTRMFYTINSLNQ